MLQTLVILYLVNGIAFVVADNFAYAGMRMVGSPYVRNPGFVNIFVAILSAPIATIYFSISRAGRGGGSIYRRYKSKYHLPPSSSNLDQASFEHLTRFHSRANNRVKDRPQVCVMASVKKPGRM